MELLSPFVIIPAIIIGCGVIFCFYYVFKIAPSGLTITGKKASIILIIIWIVNLLYSLIKIFPDSANTHAIQAGFSEVGFVTIVLILIHVAVKILFMDQSDIKSDK